jgi:hypothetical protein
MRWETGVQRENRFVVYKSEFRLPTPLVVGNRGVERENGFVDGEKLGGGDGFWRRARICGLSGF